MSTSTVTVLKPASALRDVPVLADQAVPPLATDFAWPMPPLASYPLPALRMEPQVCEVEALSGQRLVGRLLALDVEQSMVQIHVPPEPTPMPMRLEQLRHLTLTRPISPLSAVMPGAASVPVPLDTAKRRRKVSDDEVLSGGIPSEFPSDWASLGQHPRQPYKVYWVGGGCLEGETIGHVEHVLGLFVFPPVDSQGSVLRRFYPRSAFERYELGAPIGQVLVAQQVATSAQVDEALQAQDQLRKRRLGEILLARQIVTSEQLLAALDKQARMPMVRLGDALVALGHLSGEQLHEALKQQQADRVVPLGELLVQRGLVSTLQLQEALARKMGYPLVDVSRYPLPKKCLRLLPADLAQRLCALPLGTRGGRLVVAMPDPTRAADVETLQKAAGVPLIPVLGDPQALCEAVQRAYPQAAAVAPTSPTQDVVGAEHPEQMAEAALHAAVSALRPVPSAPAPEAEARAALVRLLQHALHCGGSDLHVEVRSTDAPLQVQLRRDGRLEPLEDLPANWYGPLLHWVKNLAGLDPMQRSCAQTGNIALSRLLPAPAPRADLQVSTIPTYQGLEDLVLRLPLRLALRKPEHLGWEAADLTRVMPLLERPSGLILVAGPARAGRTSTLHTLLSQLGTERKIWTVEERLEIIQNGLRQTELRPRAGWTAADALRGLAAADPDVVMVGDLRDGEAARLAVDMAASGRLVLAGVSARNAADAVVRLLDQGVDANQLADSLLGVNAQRLLRRVCRHCRMSRPAKDTEIEDWLGAYMDHALTEDPDGLRKALQADWLARRGREGKLRRYVGQGCDKCQGTGLRHRVAVHELLVGSRELRRLIRASAPAWHLQRQAQKDGMQTLRQDAIEKLLAGLTVPEELRGLSD